jgi:hypothetical protein
MRITTLFGTNEDAYVARAMEVFTFFPRKNDKDYTPHTEHDTKAFLEYMIDRMWMSEINPTEAVQFFQEAITLTDLFEDDPDRKETVKDIVEQRYFEDQRQAPSIYNHMKREEWYEKLQNSVPLTRLDKNGKKYGFGELTKAYDLKTKLTKIDVIVEQEGDIATKDKAYSETVIEFIYDWRLKQSLVQKYITGNEHDKAAEKKNGGKGDVFKPFFNVLFKAYLGDLQILGVAKTRDEEKIYYSLNGIRYLETPIEARDKLVSVIGGIGVSQPLYIIFSKLLKMDDSDKYDFVDPGFYVDEKVEIKFKESWPRKENLPQVLELLNRFYDITTNPNAFLVKLCYDLLGPFSYKMRQSGKMFPMLFLWGESRGGKTTLASFFNDIGWDNPSANLTEKNFETKYTSLRNLSNKQVSLLIDEVSTTFLMPLQHFLNSASTGLGAASRGGKGANKLDLWQYDVKAWLTMTTNDQVNLGKAFQNRLIVVSYDEVSVKKQNLQEFDKIQASLPRGFLYLLFDELFGGRKTDDVIAELRIGVSKEEKFIENLFSVVIQRLKTLYQQQGVVWTFLKDPKWERGFKSDYLVEIFQYFNQITLGNQKEIYRTSGKHGEPVPVDRYNKFGLDVDFFPESCTVDGAETQAYFITPRAFKTFAKDAAIPKEIWSMGAFVEFVGKREYLWVTSKRLSLKSQSPTKGMRVLDPETLVTEESRVVVRT